MENQGEIKGHHPYGENHGGSPIKSAFPEGINTCLPVIYYGTAFLNLLSSRTLNVPSHHNLSPKNGREDISLSLPGRQILWESLMVSLIK